MPVSRTALPYGPDAIQVGCASATIRPSSGHAWAAAVQGVGPVRRDAAVDGSPAHAGAEHVVDGAWVRLIGSRPKSGPPSRVSWVSR